MDLETWCTASLHENQQHSKQTTSICDTQGWLSVVVGGLKRAITHFANENNIGKWYQRQLWEHNFGDAKFCRDAIFCVSTETKTKTKTGTTVKTTNTFGPQYKFKPKFQLDV